MTAEPKRDALVLERIQRNLQSLREEADAIGQPLLGYILDQAVTVVGEELSAAREQTRPSPSFPRARGGSAVASALRLSSPWRSRRA